jgi:hypothetical protein
MKRSNITISNPKRGAIPINKILRGATLVWERGGATPPISNNTFIGGMATQVPDETSLAAILNTTEYPVTATDISYFNIIDNNIEATIDVSYWLDVDVFRNNLDITYFRDNSKCILVRSGAFADCQNIDHIHLNAVTKIGSSAFLRTYKCNQIHIPVCSEFTSTGNGFTVADINNLKLLYAPELKIMTTAANNSNCKFLYGNKIYVHSDLSTIDAGNPDGDLLEAIGNGMEVIYGANPNVLNLPSNFTEANIGVICSTAIQLIDDGGSSNTISHFEVTVDGAPYGNVLSGNFITGLTPETLYSLSVISVDEFNNKSEISTVSSSTVSTINSPLPQSGLAAYYKFEENINDIIDSYGSNNGTNHGVSRGVAGVVGSGIKLNNTLSNRISIPDSPSFSFTDGANDTPLSISLWFNTEDTSLNQMIINKLNTQREWFVYLVGGKIRFQLEGLGSMYAETASIFSNNTNYHLAITYDGSKTVGGIKIYINGVSKTLTTVNSSYAGTINGGDSVVIGNHGNQTSNIGFKGILDELGIYKSHELSLTEVQTIYNNGNGLTL